MSFLGTVLELLKTTWDSPLPFGAFHISSLVITLTVTVLICKTIKTPSEKVVRRLLLIISLAVIILEIYKQIVYSFSFDGGKFVFKYRWHVFPWQFCSTPMFVGLAAALVRNKKMHYMLCSYLASYGLVAGIFTMVSGASLFSSIIGINIQTMVCHGSMIVVGVFLLKSGYVKSDNSSLKAAMPLFIAGAVIAMVLNRAAYLIGIPEGQVFDMYFISPYFRDDVPLLAPFRRLLPDPLFQIVYLTAFNGLAALVLWVSGKITDRRGNKQNVCNRK